MGFDGRRVMTYADYGGWKGVCDVCLEPLVNSHGFHASLNKQWQLHESRTVIWYVESYVHVHVCITVEVYCTAQNSGQEINW